MALPTTTTRALVTLKNERFQNADFEPDPDFVTVDISVKFNGGVSGSPGQTVTYPVTPDGSALHSAVRSRVNQLLSQTEPGNSLSDADIMLWPPADDTGASNPAPLGLWDYWSETRFGHTTVGTPSMFLGVAISSGTNTTAIPATGQAGFNSHGVFLRSSTTANGGYRYQTSSLVADYFGTVSHKFRAQWMPLTAHTGRTVRLGYLDTVTVADSSDGAYFEILDGVVSAKTANNSARTTVAMGVTLSLSTVYTFDIDVTLAPNTARFRIYEGNNPVPVADQSITTNLPTTQARAFGAGIVATEVSTTASDIGVLYSLGMGTVEGFTRARG